MTVRSSGGPGLAHGLGPVQIGVCPKSRSKTTYNLFRPSLALVLASKAQVCVVQGNPDGLAYIAKHKSEALFEKGRVTDPYGRIFYSTSAYQLIIFLCDEDMKQKIDPFIPERLNKKRQAQYAELGVGGPDLIKLPFDPLEAAKKNFKTIILEKAVEAYCASQMH